MLTLLEEGKAFSLGENKKKRSVMTTKDKQQNVQDVFLNHVRKARMPVTVFLVNGVKLQGTITWFDNFSLLLTRDGQTQMVYKHAISTVMPTDDLALYDLIGDDQHGNREE